MNKESYKDYILDQLRDLEIVRVRPMFGSFGLYYENNFFAILWQGRLFFKTNSKTRKKYIELDMKPFRPNQKQTLNNYYEVPLEIVEDSDKLSIWAKQAAQL